MNRHHSNEKIRDFIIQNVEEHPGSISRLVSERFGVTRQSVNRYLLKLISDGLLTSEGKTRNKKYYLKSIIIRDFIIQNVEEHPGSISRLASERFGVTRQSVNRYLLKLISDGLLTSEGKTRSKRYYLKPIIAKRFQIEITQGPAEDQIWREYLTPLFKVKEINPNVVDICHHGFTEMFNNVIEHSEGKNAFVEFQYTLRKIKLIVADDGIGIFNKITRDLRLEDPRHAILELSKGKLTTDPQHHTGEGIFFTTRMFDEFSILSGKLFFSHILDSDDWLTESKEVDYKGTMIEMSIEPKCNRTIKEVFDKYAAEKDDYGFTRTRVPVILVKYGEENLVSRSQAKRLLSRFDRFREILLDFEGVEFIGQAFADEIFRVFKNDNPDIKLSWFRANENVEKMIKRVMNRSTDNQYRFHS